MTQGNMDFDFRKRCLVHCGDHDVIFYGMTAQEHRDAYELRIAHDLPAPYAELSVGGRTSGRPSELERHPHFFTKSMRAANTLEEIEMFKIVVTRYVPPNYQTRAQASTALKKLRLATGELAVVIEMPTAQKDYPF